MQVRDATVGPLSGTSPVSAAFTSTSSYGTTERVGDDLRVHRPRALADLGAADENPDAAIGERERRLRRELHLAAAGEARTVEEQRQADAPATARPEPVARRLRLKSVRFTASRSTCSALASLPSR